VGNAAGNQLQKPTLKLATLPVELPLLDLLNSQSINQPTNLQHTTRTSTKRQILTPPPKDLQQLRKSSPKSEWHQTSMTSKLVTESGTSAVYPIQRSCETEHEGCNSANTVVAWRCVVARGPGEGDKGGDGDHRVKDSTKTTTSTTTPKVSARRV